MEAKATLIGNVGRIDEKEKVTTFTLATTRGYKDSNGDWQKSTHWHNCVAFGKYGTSIAEKVSVGDLLYVTADIEYQKYIPEGKDDSEAKWFTKMLMNSYRILKKKNGNSSSESGDYPPPPSSDSSAPSIGDDDLPF